LDFTLFVCQGELVLAQVTTGSAVNDADLFVVGEHGEGLLFLISFLQVRRRDICRWNSLDFVLDTSTFGQFLIVQLYLA